jgi:LacI family transcriptional regulator
MTPPSPDPDAPRSVLFLAYHAPEAHPDTRALLEGARAALVPAGLTPEPVATGGAHREEIAAAEDAALRRALADPQCAGALVWQFGEAAILPALRGLRAAGKPAVFLDRRPPEGFEADHVGADNRGAAALVVRHLLDLGHRGVAHLTYDEDASSVVERGQGYRRALAERGVPARPGWVVPAVYTTSGWLPDLSELLLRWRAEGVTAVFCVSDALAMVALDAARRAGLRVPEDLSVAGFDGSESRGGVPPFLTTVEQPLAQIGRTATELLLERLHGSAAPYRHLLLRAPVLVRASTAATPG